MRVDYMQIQYASEQADGNPAAISRCFYEILGLFPVIHRSLIKCRKARGMRRARMNNFLKEPISAIFANGEDDVSDEEDPCNMLPAG